MSPVYLLLALITVSSVFAQDFTAGDFDVFKQFGETFGFSILDNFIQNSRREFYKQQLTKAIANYDRSNPAFAQIIRAIPPDVIISALEETDSQPQQTGNAFLDVLAKNGIAVPVKKTPNGTPGEVGFKDVFSSVLTDVLEKLRLQNDPAALQASFGHQGAPKTPLESTNPKDPQANRLLIPPVDAQPKDLRSIILRKLAERQSQATAPPTGEPPNPFRVSVTPPSGSTLIQAAPKSPFRSDLFTTEASFIQNFTEDTGVTTRPIRNRNLPKLITAAGPISRTRQISTEAPPIQLPKASSEDRLKELNFRALRVVGEQQNVDKNRQNPIEQPRLIDTDRFESLFSEAPPSDNSADQPRSNWFQSRGNLNSNLNANSPQVKVVPYAILQRQNNFERFRRPHNSAEGENSFRFRQLN